MGKYWKLTFVCVRYFCDFSVWTPKFPAMKGALQTVSDNTAANANMSTQVGTVGIQNVRLALFISEYG